MCPSLDKGWRDGDGQLSYKTFHEYRSICIFRRSFYDIIQRRRMFGRDLREWQAVMTIDHTFKARTII
jgi:hypothetical protein